MTTLIPEAARPITFAASGSPEYAEATAAFNLLPRVAPDGALVARSTAEVVAAVHAARRSGRGLVPHTTGHAAGGLADLTGALLVRTAIDAPVRIDAARRRAVIPAGARWGDVVAAAAPHGLAAAHGSSATVGAIGYLLRGGMSFYGRERGLASNGVRSITLVTAAGEVVTASAEHEPELFWALRGGGGGFGVVVELEVDLFPMWRVVTGMTAWDAADAARVAPLWREWIARAPRRATTSLRLMNLPPLPGVPEVLTGRQILMLDGAVSAAKPDDLAAAQAAADALLGPLSCAAEPILDTWHVGPPTDLPLTHSDPVDPIPSLSDHVLVDAGEGFVADWIAAAGPGSGSRLLTAELRQLGGAFAEPSGRGGALDRLDADLASFAAAVPMPGYDPDAVRADLARLRGALSRHDTGFTAPTFVEDVDAPHRALTEETQARVDAIRRRVDPDGLFARDVVRPREAAPRA